MKPIALFNKESKIFFGVLCTVDTNIFIVPSSILYPKPISWQKSAMSCSDGLLELATEKQLHIISLYREDIDSLMMDNSGEPLKSMFGRHANEFGKAWFLDPDLGVVSIISEDSIFYHRPIINVLKHPEVYETLVTKEELYD